MRVLHVVTNVDHYEDSGEATGLWLGELTHVWDQLERAGVEQVIGSPKGGTSPLEPRSLGRLMADASVRAHHEDPEFMARLDSTVPLVDVDWRDFDAIYLTGGHAVMYDFPGSAQLQRLIRDLDENGRIVASVCHGYAGFLEATRSDGTPFLSGRTLTGFSWTEEILAGVARKVPFDIEKRVKELGADYRKSLIPMRSFVERDGLLVTGQNPTSAKATGAELLRTLRENAR